MSELFVKILFLWMTVGSVLGIVAWVSFSRAAKRKREAGNELAALRLKTRSSMHLTLGLIEAVVGPVGYYLVSRRIFPQVDPLWLALPVTAIYGAVSLYFRVRLSRIPSDIPDQQSTPADPSAPR